MSDILPMETVDESAVVEERAPPTAPPPATPVRTRRASRLRMLGMSAAGLGIICMFVALFLPWSFLGGAGQGLAEYGAPEPSVVAWFLLALGLASCVVAAVSFLFGTRGALAAVGAGAALYLIGAAVWYVATILPNVVASGCTTNAGTLCGSPSGAPTIAAGTAAGFVVAIIASSWVLLVALVTARLDTSRPSD